MNRATGHAPWTKHLTERKPVLAGKRGGDDLLRQAGGLVRMSLEPQDARQKALGRRALVEHEADDLGADHRHLVFAEHALDVPPGPRLVAHEVDDVADHPLANEKVRVARMLGGQLGKSFGKGQRRAELASVQQAGPKTPQGSELVIGIALLFRQFEHTGPGVLRCGHGALRLHQRPGLRCVEAHLAVRAPACGGRGQRADRRVRRIRSSATARTTAERLRP